MPTTATTHRAARRSEKQTEVAKSRPTTQHKKSPAVASARSARLEFRVTEEIHEIFKRASEVTGRSMTDFVIAAAEHAAYEAIERIQVLRLSKADQECFVNALISPPEPNAALRRAFERRRQQVRSE